MKKILFVEATELKGGIETFILNIAKNIDKQEYELYLLKECERASIENEFIQLGGNILKITSFSENLFKYIREFSTILSKYNFDVIHINKNSLSNPLSIIISRKHNVPKIVLHSHNTNPTNKSASIKMHDFFKKRVSKYDLVRLACSEQAGKWMFNESDKYQLVKNGIDVNKYRYSDAIRQRKRQELGLSNQLSIISVGRLSEQKNPLFVIDIFEEVLKKSENSILFMVGTGELERSVHDYIVQKNLSSKIKLLGTRNDVNELLQAADIFLMPSLYEGLPIAAVEAQASGLPMLISDTVDKGVKLVDTTEIESLSSTASKWAEHLLKLCKSSRRIDTSEIIQESGYDINNTVNLIEDIYSN